MEFCRTCGSEIEECFTNFVPSYFPDTIENLLDISSKKELKRKLELIVKYGPRYEMTENVIIAKKLLSELTTSKE